MPRYLFLVRFVPTLHRPGGGSLGATTAYSREMCEIVWLRSPALVLALDKGGRCSYHDWAQFPMPLLPQSVIAGRDGEVGTGASGKTMTKQRTKLTFSIRFL
jgi:hypothetical protein